MSRLRMLLNGLLLATLSIVIGCISVLPAKADLSLTQYVNPLIGTDFGAPDYNLGNAAGDVFPGADYPFGMVQWSPDTTTAAGGYRYAQHTINGFSLTHFSGRGASCWLDVAFMPTLGVATSPGTHWSHYSSAFSHANESASPGYYKVTLDATAIQAEMSVTARTGMARLTYPAATTSPTLLINTGHSANGNDINGGHGTGVSIDPAAWQVSGAAKSGNCGGTFSYSVYFVAQFDRPFQSYGTWAGAALTASTTASSGPQSGAYLAFDPAQSQPVQVKVGLSFVSVANARANLQAENPGWDFTAIRSQADAAWNARLNTIQVGGGTNSDKTVFYTALYHAQLHPNIFSDVNGQYLGFDAQVHSVAPGRMQYENFAGWDNYRSEIALLALVAPIQTGDMLQSLVEMSAQGTGGLPRWQQAACNSGGMIGDSATVEIATAYAFGVTNFDTVAALQAMDRDASQVNMLSCGHPVREGLQDWLTKGYVSTATGESASRTLEYATDDFALSRFAKALGDTPKASHYLVSAQNWNNLWNAGAHANGYTGYLAPRVAKGSWAGFCATCWDSNWTEGDAAQYLWMVPFNYRALFAKMGGNRTAIARLDTYFSKLNAGPNSAYAFMGNEPDETDPWAYAFAGAAYKTQGMVRRILRELYSPTPGGYPGNDDGGAMASWVVFAAIGLYPDIPGVGGFVIGSPLFPAITVQLAGGHNLTITAPNAADDSPYVQQLQINGQQQPYAWVNWSLLTQGAELDFTLNAQPSPNWGTNLTGGPPSFDVPAPTDFWAFSVPMLWIPPNRNPDLNIAWSNYSNLRNH